MAFTNTIGSNHSNRLTSFVKRWQWNNVITTQVGYCPTLRGLYADDVNVCLGRQIVGAAAIGFDVIGRLYLAYSPCGWAIIYTCRDTEQKSAVKELPGIKYITGNGNVMCLLAPNLKNKHPSKISTHPAVLEIGISA